MAVAASASTAVAVITTTLSTIAETNLASWTRTRRGDSVNVVSAVRWVHSLVIAITPITGSSSMTPVDAAPRKPSKAGRPWAGG